MHIYRTFGRTVYLFKIINIYCYNTSEEFFYIKLLSINELFNTFCFGLWTGSELNRFRFTRPHPKERPVLSPLRQLSHGY